MRTAVDHELAADCYIITRKLSIAACYQATHQCVAKILYIYAI